MSHSLSCKSIRRKNLCVGLILGAMLLSSTAVWAEIVKVKVTGIRGTAGVVRCGLYASADGFRVPGREAFEAESAIRGGQAACSFDKVPAGRYALAVFHAEKRENQIEYGMFGKPRQGVGFSQNPSITFGAPGFDKAAFSVGKGPVNLSVALQY